MNKLAKKFMIKNEEKLNVLIIYDIVNDKRRIKFSGFLENYGKRVQKSAFEMVISKAQYNEITNKIYRYITKEDNVRVYKLRNDNKTMVFGEDISIYEALIII